MLSGQRMKDNGAINAIEKLGAEGFLYFAEQLLLHPLVSLLLSFSLIAASSETNTGAFPDKLGTNIAGHNNNAVTEINTATLGISQVTIIKYLEQYIKHIRVSLFNLIKEYATIRFTPYCFSQLPAFLIANVPWRCPNQSGYSEFLHKLRHVKPD
ncbi:hypothetical protein ES705_18869 [subsurface metagenome]